MKHLKFDANSPKDRKDIFTLVCESLLLDTEKEAKAFGIKKTAGGYVVNIDSLFNFFYKKKLKGSFDFGDNMIDVWFEVKTPKPIDPIEEPEKIEETEADEVTDSGLKDFTPLDEELMEKNYDGSYDDPF